MTVFGADRKADSRHSSDCASPRAAACRMAFRTVVLQTPASAAMTDGEGAAASLADLGGDHGQHGALPHCELTGELRRHQTGSNPATPALKALR